MLIKLKCVPNLRSELLEIVKIFRAKVVDLAYNSLTIEIVGDPGKIISIQQLLSAPHLEIVEIVRTGKIAIERDLGINTELSKIT